MDGNICSNSKLKKEHGVPRGFYFFNFVILKIWRIFLPEIAKLVEFTLETEKKSKTFPIFLVPQKKSLIATKRTVESSIVFLVNNVIQ